MESLVAAHVEANAQVGPLLEQAARELLLLQSSDWPFLITTGQAADYAASRFRQHVHRFERLAGAIEAADTGEETTKFCREFYEADKVFPDIDYRLFAEREGRVT
jgi:1,4-alpha-glucan branching enzyme